MTTYTTDCRTDDAWVCSPAHPCTVHRGTHQRWDRTLGWVSHVYCEHGTLASPNTDELCGRCPGLVPVPVLP